MTTLTIGAFPIIVDPAATSPWVFDDRMVVGSLSVGLTINTAATVPADGDLANSTFALWLDATPGATKLMVKAKDSGGTVRTATIPLT